MKDISQNFLGWGGEGSNASASATSSYHNGGVEGDAFADWYDKNLAGEFTPATETEPSGSGSGGTSGSGSGGTSGSGSGGTSGSECDPVEDSGKTPQTYTMGTDPQVTVTVTETPSGTLFFDIKPVESGNGPVDISGLFFDLTDDSGLASLNFSPAANEGSQWSPVTGIQSSVDAVNTLADGSSVPGQFDAAVQFGTQADSTNGLVESANFTLWSEDGPLSFEGIDLGGMNVLVDSEMAPGQVLTVTEGPDGTGDPVDDDCSGTGGTSGSGTGGTSGSGTGGTSGSGTGGSEGVDTSNEAIDPTGELPAFDIPTDGNGSQEDEEDVVYASGSGGTGGSGGSGGSGGTGGPGLADIMALMTLIPDDGDPSLQEDENLVNDEEPDFFF